MSNYKAMISDDVGLKVDSLTGKVYTIGRKVGVGLVTREHIDIDPDTNLITDPVHRAAVAEVGGSSIAVINDLITGGVDKPLAAQQGVILKDTSDLKSLFGRIADLAQQSILNNRWVNDPWIIPAAWTAKTYSPNTYVTASNNNVYFTCNGGTSATEPTTTNYQVLDAANVKWEYVGPAFTAPSGAPTLGISSTASTLTRFFRNSACTFTSGAADVRSNDNWFTLHGLPSSALGTSGIGSSVTWTGGIGFETDAPSVCVAMQASNAMISVTDRFGRERWVNLGRIDTDTGSSVRYVTVTFATREFRTWKVWSVQKSSVDGIIKGVYVDRLSICHQPKKVSSAPTVMYLGDSFSLSGAAYNAGAPFAGLGPQMFGRIGIDRVFVNGSGGTGFVAGGSNAYTQSSRTNAISTAMPDVLVVMGSVNDTTANGATLAAMTTAVSSFIDTARWIIGAKAPIIITGVMGKNATYGEGTIEANLRQAIAAKADPYTYFIPCQGDSQPWMYAGGNVGSQDGTGNADLYTSADNVHPNQRGKDYLGGLLASAMMKLAMASR